MQEDCVFCKIVKGELPSSKVFEDDDLYVFNDINPKAPVHIILTPKKHIKMLAEVKEEDCELLGKIQLMATKIARERGISEAFKLTTNNGAGAGQTVMHIHYHLIGGWNSKNDVVSELSL